MLSPTVWNPNVKTPEGLALHKSREKYRNRAETIVTLVEGGATLEEVGHAFGITRERVRQVYTKTTGRSVKERSVSLGSTRVLQVLSHVRWTGSEVDSWRDAFSAVYSSTSNGTTIRSAIRELGLEPAILRLFRARKSRKLRRQVVAALREVARTTGRNPKLGDFFATGAGAGVGTIYKAFGSFPRALAAAGFPPNPRGNKDASLSVYDQQRLARGQEPVGARKKRLAEGAPRDKPFRKEG